ncbi:DUF188 domain-containing protein [Mycoplasma sp. P36-A1]|uniref:DUF188 domain-containing protein n=1 Tax=Mycoplasma sp. P36-A1 TaxID=3252900 RepID=UPI003C2B3A9C
MKIIVDADANPTNDIVMDIAKRYNLELIYVHDSSHLLTVEYGSVIIVDKGADSADFKILSIANKYDIAITQDYELASLLLSKRVYIIHPNGFEINMSNIDTLMQTRYLNKKASQAKIRLPKIKKRTTEDNNNFRVCLENLITGILNGEN